MERRESEKAKLLGSLFEDDDFDPELGADAEQQLRAEPQESVLMGHDQALDPAGADQLHEPDQASLREVESGPEVRDDLRIRPSALDADVPQTLRLSDEIVFLSMARHACIGDGDARRLRLRLAEQNRPVVSSVPAKRPRRRRQPALPYPTAAS